MCNIMVNHWALFAVVLRFTLASVAIWFLVMMMSSHLRPRPNEELTIDNAS